MASSWRRRMLGLLRFAGAGADPLIRRTRARKGWFRFERLLAHRATVRPDAI